MEDTHRSRGFGRALRDAREAAGYDIHDLSDTTKVQTRYIEALETENWQRVPGGVIGRGFVRIIAREIGADSEKLIELYSVARGEEPLTARGLPPETQIGYGRTALDPRRILLLLIAALVIAGGFYGWKYYQKNRAVAKEEARTFHRLEIKALQNTWVRIKAKGVTEEKTPLGANEAISFDLEEVAVEMPDASHVQLSWDGEVLKEAGKPGEAAAARLPRDLESLRP